MNKPNKTKTNTDTVNRAVVTSGEGGRGRVKRVNCMEMNGNKICDGDLSVQMLNDNSMHLKLKKRKKERKALFFSPSKKITTFRKRNIPLG